MRFSCGFTEQYGIPVHHIVHVTLKYGDTLEAFTHHDVDIRHHNNYCMFVATQCELGMNSEEKAIQKDLIQACQQEIGLCS